MQFYNIEGEIQEIIKSRDLAFGTIASPVFVTDATTTIAPNGQCFYTVKPFNADAVISTAWGLDGQPISALSGISLLKGSTLYDRFLAIEFTDTSSIVQLQVMNTGVPTPFVVLVDPYITGSDTEGGAINVVEGIYSLTPDSTTYAWYLDGVLQPDEIISSVNPTSAGDYYCIVTATYSGNATPVSISTQTNTFTVNPV